MTDPAELCAAWNALHPDVPPLTPWRGGTAAPADFDDKFGVLVRNGMHVAPRDWPIMWTSTGDGEFEVIGYRTTNASGSVGVPAGVDREAWLEGISGHALVFDDGTLTLFRDGTGELSFRDEALDWNPDPGSSTDYRTMKLPASEVIAIRDQLNKLFPPASALSASPASPAPSPDAAAGSALASLNTRPAPTADVREADQIEVMARALYECERERSNHVDRLLSAANGRPLRYHMEHWNDVADLYRDDARAALKALATLILPAAAGEE